MAFDTMQLVKFVEYAALDVEVNSNIDNTKLWELEICVYCSPSFWMR